MKNTVIPKRSEGSAVYARHARTIIPHRLRKRNCCSYCRCGKTFESPTRGNRYFLCNVGGKLSSASSALLSSKTPKKRILKVSPIPANTSEQVSRNRFSAALAIVSKTVCECC